MEENKSRQAQSDDIDITEIFRWFGRGIRSFGNGIIAVIAGLRNTLVTYKVFFLLLTMSGLVCGWVYHQLLSKRHYKSSMIISCDYMNNRIMENAIGKLNMLCREREREGLSAELNIDIQVAKNIRSFNYRPFVSEKEVVELEVLKEQLNNVAAEKKDLVEKVISKLDIENKHAFQIEVLIYSPDIVKDLEKAIVQYFYNNEYVKRRVEINKQNLESRKDKLLVDSKKLDSLKQVLYQNYQSMAKQSREGSNNVILSDKYLMDPLGVYAEDLNLNSEILRITEKLYVQPDFELVDGFTIFKEPDSAGLAKILVIALFISIASCYLIIGLWKFDHYLSNYYSGAQS